MATQRESEREKEERQKRASRNTGKQLVRDKFNSEHQIPKQHAQEKKRMKDEAQESMRAKRH